MCRSIQEMSEQESPTIEATENSVGEKSKPLSTLIVVEFHPQAQQPTIDWLVHKIQAKRKHGGAELLVDILPSQNERVNINSKKKYSCTKIQKLYCVLYFKGHNAIHFCPNITSLGSC